MYFPPKQLFTFLFKYMLHDLGASNSPKKYVYKTRFWSSIILAYFNVLSYSGQRIFKKYARQSLTKAEELKTLHKNKRNS